jgi:hypothetical protein
MDSGEGEGEVDTIICHIETELSAYMTTTESRSTFMQHDRQLRSEKKLRTSGLLIGDECTAPFSQLDGGLVRVIAQDFRHKDPRESLPPSLGHLFVCL